MIKLKDILNEVFDANMLESQGKFEIYCDLDGVLVEAKEIHFNALNSALEEINPNLVISWEEHLRCYDGLKTYDKLKVLSFKKYPRVTLSEEVQDQIFISKQNHTIQALKNLRRNLGNLNI